MIMMMIKGCFQRLGTTTTPRTCFTQCTHSPPKGYYHHVDHEDHLDHVDAVDDVDYVNHVNHVDHDDYDDDD